METMETTLSNGNTIKYKIVNGTAYHFETDDKIVSVLESARINRTRIQIFYGDVITGRDWNESYDTKGYVGRSTGTIQIPILIHNSRSSSGGSILDHCIVKIITSKGRLWLYKHPTFHPMPMPE